MAIRKTSRSSIPKVRPSRVRARKKVTPRLTQAQKAAQAARAALQADAFEPAQGTRGTRRSVLTPSRPTVQTEARQPVQSAQVSAAGDSFSKNAVSPEQLRRIMPNLSAARAEQMAPHLNRAMDEAGINTPQRAAAFLAQLAHESGGLVHFEELASGRAYEGRRDLGNVQPGDGVRFKGRGPIQLTGRANYAAAGKALGLDLVNNPELAARPDVGFRVAAWYWNSRGLNALADRGQFDAITQRINGGQNGAADRRQYFARANSVLGGGFDGGPLSTGSTPVPSTGRVPRTYDVERGQTRRTADAGLGRMSDSYAERARPTNGGQAINRDMFFMLLLDLMLGVDPEELKNDPAFLAFAKAAGWKPGQAIPQALAAEYLAHALAERVAAGEDPQAAAQALKGAAAGS